MAARRLEPRIIKSRRFDLAFAVIFPSYFRGSIKARKMQREVEKEKPGKLPVQALPRVALFHFFTAVPADPNNPGESWYGQRRYLRSTDGPAPAWTPGSLATDTRSSDWS